MIFDRKNGLAACGAPSYSRTGLRCPEPRTARHPKARKPKIVPAGRVQFEKARIITEARKRQSESEPFR